MSSSTNPAAKYVTFRNVWSGATFTVSGEGVERMRALTSWVVARR